VITKKGVYHFNIIGLSKMKNVGLMFGCWPEPKRRGTEIDEKQRVILLDFKYE
jgi:hypothetical protein